MPSSLTGHSKIDNVENESVYRYHLASHYHYLLESRLDHFRKRLTEVYELGVTVSSDTGTFTFYLEELHHADPHLVSLSGTTEDGAPIEVIQDVSKINLVLRALPRRAT